MPLHKIQSLGKDGGWAIWHATESEGELRGLVATTERPDNVSSKVKRIEWLAGRKLASLLAESCGIVYSGIGKDEYGKPSLLQSTTFITLSHSFPYVAAQISTRQEVGIDIEQPKEKLLRIGPRVLSESEFADAGKDLAKNCIYWCAKEALYKIYGKRGITFAQHLHIAPFELTTVGSLQGRISVGGSEQIIELGYEVTRDYVVVYTK